LHFYSGACSFQTISRQFAPQIEQNVQWQIIQMGKKAVNYDHFTGGNSLLSGGASLEVCNPDKYVKIFDRHEHSG
jgi:hypothetical protein